MSEEISHDRRHFLGSAAMTIAALQLGMTGSADAKATSQLASLGRGTQWLNSSLLTADSLRGKVVLIDFWTYTCINWLRHLPLCPRLGREIQGPRIGGDRRARS